MDLNKLSNGEKVIGVSAIVLFIASFLDWFTVKVGVAGFSASAGGNGWDVGFLWGGLPTLLGLAMLAYVVVTNFVGNVELPEAPWGKIVFGAGCVAAFLVVLKLLIGEDSDFPGVSVDRSFGIFLAALAAIGLAVGGFFYMREREGAPGTTAM